MNAHDPVLDFASLTMEESIASLMLDPAFSASEVIFRKVYGDGTAESALMLCAIARQLGAVAAFQAERRTA